MWTVSFSSQNGKLLQWQPERWNRLPLGRGRNETVVSWSTDGCGTLPSVLRQFKTGGNLKVHANMEKLSVTNHWIKVLMILLYNPLIYQILPVEMENRFTLKRPLENSFCYKSQKQECHLPVLVLGCWCSRWGVGRSVSEQLGELNSLAAWREDCWAGHSTVAAGSAGDSRQAASENEEITKGRIQVLPKINHLEKVRLQGMFNGKTSQSKAHVPEYSCGKKWKGAADKDCTRWAVCELRPAEITGVYF